MGRTYIGAVYKRINFDFCLKIKKKREIFGKMLIFWYALIKLMISYGLYLNNPSTESIFILHMERTYIGAVRKRIYFDF